MGIVAGYESEQRPVPRLGETNARAHEGLEKILPEGDGRRERDVRRVARDLVFLIVPTYPQETMERVTGLGGAVPHDGPAAAQIRTDTEIQVPQAYATAMAELRIGYSDQNVVELATGLVDSLPDPEHGLPEVRGRSTFLHSDLEELLPQGDDARANSIRRVARDLSFLTLKELGELRRATAPPPPLASAGGAVSQREAMLASLDEDGRDLITHTAGAESFGEEALDRFLAMDPGVRELRMRNLAACAWTGGYWRTDLQRYEVAIRSVKEGCGLREPTAEEMRAACLDPANLSVDQKEMVATMFGVRPDDVRGTEIECFGDWVSGNGERLRASWEKHYPDRGKVEDLVRSVRAGKGLDATEGMLLASILREHAGDMDRGTVAKVCAYSSNLEQISAWWLSTDKSQRMMQWRRGQVDLMAAGELAHKMRFVESPIYSAEEKQLTQTLTRYAAPWEESDLGSAWKDHVEGDGKVKTYRLALLELYGMGQVMDPGSLLVAARREADFRTLVKGLGVEYPEYKGTIDLANCACVSRISKPGSGSQARASEDAVSRVIVDGPGGRIILAGEWDGMGGHNSGEHGGMKNGERASRIAREVFDIYAVAGWIRNPEDVRRSFVVADLAMVMEQIKGKETDDDTQENDMGTTALVGFQKGDALYFIHCGDSQGAVFRRKEKTAADGRVYGMVFSTVEHTTLYALERQLRDILAEEWRGLGYGPDYSPEDFSAAVKERFASLYGSDSMVTKNNMVCSAVGFPQHIGINNADGKEGYAPIKLLPGDVWFLFTDGITKPVCIQHEIPIIIKTAEENGWEFTEVVQTVIKLAETRPRRTVAYGTLCYPDQCASKRNGGNDDKSIVMQRADELLS